MAKIALLLKVALVLISFLVFLASRAMSDEDGQSDSRFSLATQVVPPVSHHLNAATVEFPVSGHLLPKNKPDLRLGRKLLCTDACAPLCHCDFDGGFH